MVDDERKMFEQKIDELTRANDKCSQYITKREQEHRHREKLSLNIQQIDQTKRKYNDEIHRLYDQVYFFLSSSYSRCHSIILDRQTKSTTIALNR